MVNSGSQPGIISCNFDEAFKKILEKFETTTSTKFKIPGQAAIDVPMTFSDGQTVIYEINVMLDLNEKTRKAF